MSLSLVVVIIVSGGLFWWFQGIMRPTVPVTSADIFYVRRVSDVCHCPFSNLLVVADGASFIVFVARRRHALICASMRLVRLSWERRRHMCDVVD